MRYNQCMKGFLACVVFLAIPTWSAAQTLPLFDAHIHYNSDAWERLSPRAVIRLLDDAGIEGALVSSTPDDGTLRLFEAAPERIVPELRPYRTPADVSTWHRDPSIVPYLEQRLRKGVYKGIGEFHLHGAQARSPIVQRVVELAAAGNLVLHAHSDPAAVEALFAINPRIRVLWAHAGMDAAIEDVARLLEKHDTLWLEISYRNDLLGEGRLDAAWKALMLRHPDRILYGTDTWTPSRFDEIGRQAKAARAWLRELPDDVAARIAYRNGAALFGR